MAHIFISYRRDDTGYIASMLAKELVKTFGNDSVFLDVDNIPFGVDFRTHLDQAVAKCDVLLAIVGDRFLDVQTAAGTRRLDDPTDFVRIEIEAALRRGIPIIPVVTEAATMPRECDLPPSLKPFAFRNGAELRSGRNLQFQTEALLKGIQDLVTSGKSISKPSTTKLKRNNSSSDMASSLRDQTPKDQNGKPATSPAPSNPAPKRGGMPPAVNAAQESMNNRPKPSATGTQSLLQSPPNHELRATTKPATEGGNFVWRILRRFLVHAFLLYTPKTFGAKLFRVLFFLGLLFATFVTYTLYNLSPSPTAPKVSPTAEIVVSLSVGLIFFVIPTYLFAWLPAIILDKKN